jgi:hypothetical protein
MLTERWFREAIRALERIRDEVDNEIARLTRENAMRNACAQMKQSRRSRRAACCAACTEREREPRRPRPAA